MSNAKYRDRETGRSVEPVAEGCPLECWGDPATTAPCAWHVGGFPVFLPADRLEDCDEYRDRDPYGISETLDNDFQRRRRELTLDLIRRAGGEGPFRILDVGCGRGHLSAAMAEAFPQAEVSALDHSLSGIARARELYKNVDFCVADAYRPPYAHGYFDVVVLNNIWEHLLDPMVMLERLSPVLRDGGAVVVSTPNRYRRGNLLRALRGRPMGMMSKHHVTEYTVGQMVEQLAWVGYDVVEVASRPMTTASLQARIVGRVFGLFAALTGSRHLMESTLFYRARKRAETA